MYFLDKKRNQESSKIYKVKNNFDYPLHKDKNGSYKIKSGECLRVCLTSDFFIEEADIWRHEAWEINQGKLTNLKLTSIQDDLFNSNST